MIVNKKCYFRTEIDEKNKKALIQLTTRCNMKCKHCFVNSLSEGIDLSYEEINENLIQFLIKEKIKKVTLTGGEPLLHKNILDICKKIIENKMTITICTNAYFLNDKKIKEFNKLKKVLFNISLDSINETAYEAFRGKKNTYIKVIENIKILKKYNLLKGILVTPNIFSSIEEYIELIEFAENISAKYVLFNPIAKMGRGKESASEFGYSTEKLKKLENEIIKSNFKIEIILVKFPNNIINDKCISSNLIYIYANGDVVNCPYLSFIDRSKKIGTLNSEKLIELNHPRECTIE